MKRKADVFVCANAEKLANNEISVSKTLYKSLWKLRTGGLEDGKELVSSACGIGTLDSHIAFSISLTTSPPLLCESLLLFTIKRINCHWKRLHTHTERSATTMQRPRAKKKKKVAATRSNVIFRQTRETFCFFSYWESSKCIRLQQTRTFFVDRCIWKLNAYTIYICRRKIQSDFFPISRMFPQLSLYGSVHCPAYTCAVNLVTKSTIAKN